MFEKYNIKLTIEESKAIVAFTFGHYYSNDILLLYCINETLRKHLRSYIEHHKLIKSSIDELREQQCMICKVYHEKIVVLPCGHGVCLEKLFELRIEIGPKCVACKKEYAFCEVTEYRGKTFFHDWLH